MLFQLLATSKKGAQKIFFLNDTHQNLFSFSFKKKLLLVFKTYA